MVAHTVLSRTRLPVPPSPHSVENYISFIPLYLSTLSAGQFRHSVKLHRFCPAAAMDNFSGASPRRSIVYRKSLGVSIGLQLRCKSGI